MSITSKLANLQITSNSEVTAIMDALPSVPKELATLIRSYWIDRDESFLPAKNNEEILRIAATSKATQIDLSMHDFLLPDTVVKVLQNVSTAARITLPTRIAERILYYNCSVPIQQDRVRIAKILVDACSAHINKVFINASKAGRRETALDVLNDELAETPTDEARQVLALFIQKKAMTAADALARQWCMT